MSEQGGDAFCGLVWLGLKGRQEEAAAWGTPASQGAQDGLCFHFITFRVGSVTLYLTRLRMGGLGVAPPRWAAWV